MALSDRLRGAITALLGVSAYQPPREGYGPQLDEDVVEKTREAMGGQLQPLPTTRLRWYIEDLEHAQAAADNGFLQPAAQLCRAMRRDGTLKGLRNARTKGLIRLPKRFYGNEEIASVLRARNGTRSVFDEMFPPSECHLLIGDGLDLGIGAAELVPVRGRNFPVMVRLEPEFLQYRWVENRWYFNSLAGAIPIVPGDGRWILHVPGGRLTPWADGLWPALGRAFINKEHAIAYRTNYCAKLANPARVAYAPIGATEVQRLNFFRRLLAWGVNTVFEMPIGWDVKLLETNGRGWEVFQEQIEACDLEYMVALSGQYVTTTGGTGFSNQEVPERIRKDLIQGDADEFAYTINTQGLPQFIVQNFDVSQLQEPAIVEWDTGTVTDREKESRVMSQVGDAIEKLNKNLVPYDKKLDIAEVATRFGVPTSEGAIEVVDSDVDSASLEFRKDTPPPVGRPSNEEAA